MQMTVTFAKTSWMQMTVTFAMVYPLGIPDFEKTL
jgi:hypothetical protein